ncbi:OmpA family protein [Tenacibaculum sp. MEBiC06402]
MIGQSKYDRVLNNLGNDILFVYKDTILEEGSLEKIKDVATYINKNNKSYFVDSHTCTEGGEMYNLELTKKRAAIVRKKLIGFGVDSLRITPRGRGEMHPVYIVISARHNFKNRIIRFTEK